MCTKKHTPGNKIGYKAKLHHWFSSKLHMRIHPKFKSRQGGDFIQDGDEIILESSKENYYLDIAPDLPYYLNHFHIDIEKSVYTKEISLREIRAKKYSVMYSNGSKVSWRFILFQKYDQDPEEISGFDLLRINHTELNGGICSTLKFRSTAAEVYIRDYYGDNSLEKDSVSEIWEVQHTSTKRLGAPIKIQELKSSELGALNEADYQLRSESVKFKHFLSQRYLFAVAYKKTAAMSDFIMLVSNHTLKPVKKNYVKLSMVPVISNMYKVLNGKSYQLKSSNGYVRMDTKIQLTRKYLLKTDAKDSGVETNFMPLTDDDLDERYYVCVMKAGNDNEHAFKMQKVERNEVKDILFARSALPFITYFISYFSKKRLNMLKPSMYLRMDIILCKICCFIFMKPYRDNIDIFSFDGEPNPDRQRIMRELNFLDYLCELLSRPFDKGLFDIKVLRKNMPITRVLALTYTTIRYIIKENRPNELYCSQWLNLFLDHSLKTKGLKHIMAEKTLTELIDNNKTILTKRINKGTVNKFIQLVSEDRVAKYIDILRVIIICNEKPLLGNQREISPLLLKDKKMRERLVYELRRYNKVIQFKINKNVKDASSNDDWHELAKINKVSQGLEALGATVDIYPYFVSLTFLLGDLCLKRNYLAIESLQKLFAFDFFYDIITSDSFPSNVRESFAYLFTSLWVDVSPMQKKRIPNHIKLWEEDEDFRGINDIVEGHRTSFNDIKNETINYLRGFQETFLYESGQTSFMINMLKLLKKMIQMDLVDKDDIRNTFEILIKLLNSIVRMYQQSSREIGMLISFNQMNLLNQTAILVCSMLKLIFFFEIDIKSSLILQGLRQHILSMDDETSKKFKRHYNSMSVDIIKQILEFNMDKKRDEGSNVFSQTIESFDNIFKEVIKKDECFTVNHDKSIVMLLIILSNNSKEERLSHSAIELLYLIYSQSRLIEETLSGMQLVSKAGIKDYHEIIDLAAHLSSLSESCEKWFVSVNAKEQTEIRLVLDKLLNMLIDSSEENTALKSSRQIHPIFIDRISCTFVGTSSYHQNIYRNSGILKSLIKILEWDLVYHQYLAVKVTQGLLSSIYEILSFCCLKNSFNKASLLKYIHEPFMKHFHSKQGIGSISLLNHLIESNEDLLNDEATVKSIREGLFKKLEVMTDKNPTKAFILKMISTLLNNDEQKTRSHRNIVLQKIYEKKESDFPKVNAYLLKEWSDAVWNSEVIQINANRKGAIIPAELCHFLAYFELLTMCADGKNSFAENMSQNIVDLDEIKKYFEAIRDNDIHPIIQLCILHFFYEVYLETERDNFFHFQKILDELIKMMVDNLLRLLNNPLSPEKSSLFTVTHSQCEKNSFYELECIILSIDCFENILKKNIQLNSTSSGFEAYIYFIDKLQFIGERFVISPNKEIEQRVTELMLCITENTSYEVFRYISKTKQRMSAVAMKGMERIEKNTNYLSKELKGSIWNPKRRKGRRTTEKIKIHNNVGNDTTALMVSSFISDYFKDRKFKLRSQEEFKSFVTFLTEIEDYNLKSLSLKGTSFDDFCSTLIRHLYPSEEGETKNISDFVTGLSIFRLYIEDANPSATIGIAHWDVDDWNEVQEEVVLRQNRLLKLDIVKLITAIISRISNEKVFTECMKLSIGLTIGGNYLAQSKFLEAFDERIKVKAFHSMKTDTWVLERISNMLGNCLKVVREVYEEMSEIVVKFSHQGDGREDSSYLETLKDYDQTAEKYLKMARKIYRFLQLLCEGHNIQLQNYLREQFPKDHAMNSKNINFIKDTALVFGAFVKYINPAVIYLGKQIFDFLIEVVQGPCKQNQIVLHETKIVDYCKDLLNEFATEKDFKMKGFEGKNEEIESMIKMSIKLLYALLEANNNKEMLEYIAFNIDFDYLMKMLTKEFIYMFRNTSLTEKQLEEYPVEKLDSYLNISIHEDEVAEAFDIFFLIQVLNIHTCAYNTKIHDLVGLQLKAFEMFKFHSGQIQLVFNSDDKLYNVYFIIQPACRNLDESYRLEFLSSINRDSPKEKIIDILSKSANVFYTIEHLSKLLTNRKFYSPSTDLYVILRQFSFGTASIINILIFIFFEKRLDYGASVDDEIFNSSHPLLITLGVIHFFLGVLLFVVWVRVKAPLVVMNSMRKMFRLYKNKILISKYDGPMPDLDFKETPLEDIPSNKRISLLQKVHEILGNKFSTPKIEYFVMRADFFFSDYDFKYIFTNLSISIAAIVMKQAFFFGLLLFDVIYHVDILQNVLKAISQNYDLILVTAMLVILCILFYAGIGHTLFPEDFFMFDIGSSGENTCTSLYHCFLTILALGPRSSGSVGDVMIDISYSLKSKYFVRYFFDIAVFISVNVILMNLIFGIIIDAFAELRNKKNIVDNDMKNYCTICSNHREIFDKHAQGFEYHIQEEHNVWNYLFYVYGLKKKDSTEYSGMESYVSKMIKNGNTSWIPIQRALSVSEAFESNEDSIEKKMDVLLEELKKINEVLETTNKYKLNSPSSVN